jgi:hypothetical protein
VQRTKIFVENESFIINKVQRTDNIYRIPLAGTNKNNYEKLARSETGR